MSIFILVPPFHYVIFGLGNALYLCSSMPVGNYGVFSLETLSGTQIVINSRFRFIITLHCSFPLLLRFSILHLIVKQIRNLIKILITHPSLRFQPRLGPTKRLLMLRSLLYNSFSLFIFDVRVKVLPDSIFKDVKLTCMLRLFRYLNLVPVYLLVLELASFVIRVNSFL